MDKYAIQNCPDLLKKENIIAWCSFQSAAKDFETFDENGEEIETDELEEKWQKQVAEADWDIIITDECHFGVDTKRSSSLINKILENENTFLLEISATPFKKINRGDYNDKNIYAYTLIKRILFFFCYFICNKICFIIFIFIISFFFGLNFSTNCSADISFEPFFILFP